MQHMRTGQDGSEMVEATVAGDAVAARAIAFAQKNNTPLTPQVFEVWYTYCARESQEINTALDTAMNTGAPMTSDMLTTLYHDHLSTRSMNDQLSDIGEDLQTTIGSVTDAVEKNLKDQTEYSGSLRSVKQSLALGTSKQEVSSVITRLHKMNQNHVASSQKLTVQLEKSRAQISKLKSELIEVRRASNTDYLTGLANRRMLDDFMDSALFDARQKKQKLAFMMGAIDGLSEVTARHGLTAGDNVMKLFAEELRRQLRGNQVAARFAGARFAVLLPDTGDREAFAIAERVRKGFKRLDWVAERSGEEIGTLSISFGGALLKPSETKDDLVSRADNLLLKAQREGADETYIG
ncbi:GGDEF domain-containing protein [Halovulum sp. GXIMD14793]